MFKRLRLVSSHGLRRKPVAEQPITYKADFRVTTKELLARGLAASQGQEFRAFVADCAAGGLSGYAVVQEIPFTFDLRPTLVLKELFVAAADRSRGVGTALMEAVIAYARRRGCGRLRWLVLPGNDAAKRFYERFGGAIDNVKFVSHILRRWPRSGRIVVTTQTVQPDTEGHHGERYTEGAWGAAGR